MTGAPTAFDVGGRLPRGRIALEASAGTGKTHAIVGLAARYLAEGWATADQLLVVTFARSATRELRQRLLTRIADGVDVLQQALDGAPPGSEDVDRALVADPGGRPLDDAGLRGRRDRLTQALADVDRATISTIHGFAAECLARLGDGGGALLEDDRAFAAQVAGDLYLRAAREDPAGAAELPYFDLAGPDIARAAIALDDPAAIRPEPSLASRAGARAWLAVEAHHEAARRKARARVHTHDDLLRRLARRLTDPVHGAAAARACGDRYRVALVDEFQDTDPVQWAVLAALFPDVAGARAGVGAAADGAAGAGRVLVLVGDPKQAIYGFRGADVHAYTAVRGPAPSHTLTTNHRSDRPVVDAVLHLFGGQPLGTGITVPPVQAASGGRLSGLSAPAVLIHAVPDDAPLRRTAAGAIQVASLRDAVARDVARQAVVLLAGTAAIAADGADPRPVHAGDLAVLVRTRRQAALVQRHLVAAGVPSVVNGVGTVTASRAARDWGRLLRALDRPADGRQARLAALTDLVGWAPADVLAADRGGPPDPAAGAHRLRGWDALHVALHRWRGVLESDGVAAALRHVAAETDLAARLLAQPDGQRRLTDLVHVAELLHGHAQAGLAGVPGLVAWLDAAMADAAGPADPQPPADLALRLERDGDAVQIMTVHGAKGLQFGIVLAPYLWDGVGGWPVTLDVHDPDLGRRLLYGGRDARDPDHDRLLGLHAQQAGEEERRLAYVAATRARHHLQLWFAPGPSTRQSPLGTILGRGTGGVATTAAALDAVAALAQASLGVVGARTVDVDAPVPALASDRDPVPVSPAARLDRVIDAGWRRTSYSRLVGDAAAAADAAGGPGDVDTATAPVVADQDDGHALDHAGIPTSPQPADPALAAPVPLGRMPGGADVGTTVHAIMEHVDFAAADLAAAVADQVRHQQRRHAIDLGRLPDPDADGTDDVVAGLVAAIRTPLDPGGWALADVGRGDRLDELGFELPVVCDRGPGRADRVLVGHVADLLDAHLPAGDPLEGYAAVLRRHLADVEVRGFLAGYIDLVVRQPDGRYLVADHKTNRLAPAGTDPLTVGHFAPAAMAAEMRHHHYPLQALLYVVAVHRYLRWRLAGYDPDRHLAGVAYLFLRGMVGPDTPVVEGMSCGVFRWRPPTGLVRDLDGLLARGAGDRGGAA